MMRRRRIDYSVRPLIALVRNPVNSRRQAAGFIRLVSPYYRSQRAPISINPKVDVVRWQLPAEWITRSRAKNAVRYVGFATHDSATTLFDTVPTWIMCDFNTWTIVTRVAVKCPGSPLRHYRGSSWPLIMSGQRLWSYSNILGTCNKKIRVLSTTSLNFEWDKRSGQGCCKI